MTYSPTVLILSSLVLLAACQKKMDGQLQKPLDNIKAIEKQIEVSPSYPNYINYGLALSSAGRLAEAMAAYNNAVKINDKAPVAYNNICSLYSQQGQYLDAIENCERALTLEPAFHLAKNNLEYNQAQLKNLKKTLDEKNKIPAKFPKNGNELIGLGLQAYNIRDYKMAIKIWSRIDQKDSLYARAQNNIGSAYILLKEFSRAEKALKVALKIEPSNPLFQNNQAWLEQAKKTK